MLRDFKFLRRNSSKNPHSEEAENLPVNPKEESLNPHMNNDPSRPPLSAIQEASRIPRGISDQESSSFKSNRVDRTPTKPKPKYSDTLPFRTPEKQGLMSKNRFDWAQKSEYASAKSVMESKEEGKVVAHMNSPGSSRAVGRGNLSYSECNSTQSTPTKSVNKPPNQGFSLASGSRSMMNAGARMANYAGLPKGIPSSCNPLTVVNTAEVPYFELKEDPSFWMEHNVQVLIRVRPLNNMEKSSFGFSRCLKQETAQSITWVGQPETRFMFDHVACESIDQETLFRMVGLPMVENCLSGYNSCMFAYGQTGSGKTYTMLGEIEGLEVKPSPNRGMTPRIFEFLFARIRAEEEIRRDEKLKYNCKCSFLEIYNEQITDLLDPSSANLMLREDMKNGVYVENLSEFEVHTVGDILHLLTQGSANRRVAATNMNRESSRSHSVFTCVIESRWEKDSNTNFRFARLNLVDLAGSERQKSSGAEGERLKEAANINKSLSTLGHVIMVLVDVAHGRPRHIPYRDSRLTFLLQDSLGGNSKTMIIANVSPSICSASETLNTLKFAQRAKLIQNNAIINEDSSGDVIALKRQIQLLKEELSALKCEKVNRSLSFRQTIDMDTKNNDEDDYDNTPGKESHGVLKVSCKQLKSLECTLAGAMRREKMAETSIKKLEAEIEHLNRLVSQREEDTRCTKMMLKFREDKIQRMESLLGGSMSADDYLLKENNALSEENQLLRARLDKNPEVTRFALENIRLLEQVRRYQDLYEEGEREMLMTEVSELRNQLICSFDGNSKHPNHLDKKVSNHGDNEKDLVDKELKITLSQLEESKNKLNCCLEENAKLRGEIEKLHSSLDGITSATQEHDCSAEVIKESIVEVPLFSNQSVRTTEVDNDQERSENLVKHAENVMDLQLELDILKTILQEERSYRTETEEMVKSVNGELQLSKQMVLSVTEEYEKAHEELEKAKLVIEALESEQILSINEIEDLRNNNARYEQLLNVKKLEKADCQVFRDLSYKHSESEDSPLEAKLKKMHESLEKTKKLNKWYQNDLASQESNETEMEEARKQVEAETAEVIVCLQEELSVLQQEVQESKTKEMKTRDKLALLQTEMKTMEDNLLRRNEDNAKLTEMLDCKEKQLTTLVEEWDLIGSEIEGILSGGNEALKDVSDQIDIITSSIPHERSSISEKIGTLKKYISEKELLIEELNRCLEGAVDRKDDMECMLRSLRGAALIMTETHQYECSEKDKKIQLLTCDLNNKSSTVDELQRLIEHGKCQLEKASSCATAAFVIVNRLWELNSNYQDDLNNKNAQLREFQEIIDQKDTILHKQASIIDEADKQASKEQRNLQAVQVKMEENEIFKTMENLKELSSGVSTLKICMNDYVSRSRNPQKDKADECQLWTGTRIEENINNVESCNNAKECITNDNKLVCKSIQKSENGRDATITLLKTEMESALKSLKEVQAEMAKLRCEKQDMLASEKCNRKSIESLINQAVFLQDVIDRFEGEFELKVDVLDCKIRKIEEIVLEFSTSWLQQRELLEAELNDAKVVAAQKSIEASCIFEKFEEVQDTVTEADIMINELMIANEALKIKAYDMKVKENYLTDERNILIEEVQSLKLSNNLKDQNLKEKDELLQYQEENFMIELSARDFELLILSTELKQMFLLKTELEETCIGTFENFKKDIVFKSLDAAFVELILLDKEDENVFLRNELRVHEISKSEYLNALNLKNVDLSVNVDKVSCKIHNLIAEKFVEKFEKIVNEMEKPYKFVEQFEHLENLAMQLDSGFLSLQMELSRKDDILKGLLFDLSLLQESASSSKDQKDEMERVMTSFRELELDFDLKSAELDKAVAEGRILKAQLQENMAKLSDLELDIAKKHEIINSLSSENGELLNALEAKKPMEKELIESRMKNENLEMEVAEMEMVLTRMSKTTETLKDKLDAATCQRDEMDDKVLSLTKELEMAKALAEENEAIAIETQEIAEFHKVNAEEKEEEVKLLERSIEELECTINVLEQKVDIVKGEAEMQRLQREELQLELLAVKEQMQNVESNDSEIKRCLDEKEKKLQEARQRVELLEKEIAARDCEISQCKAHISELNLHAEAQARENRQKLKALESMVEQVKSEVPATHITNSSSNKLERNSSKPRGSGSPFKCIGLGLQIKSERDEELSAGRKRIDELEGLLAGRQKEIFMLNARLAATESMTHDVIRDLLGVKMNMNSYASLMDNQQLHSLMEEAQHHNAEDQVKEREVVNLKQQINDFVEERNGWLEEIERKQAEMMSMHVALEKLRQQDQFLAAKNEMLKMANSNNKKRIMELEGEVKKLSGQQNIQQRIHHHAKIKEENNTLKCQNEELSIKLRKTEAILSRVKEELAQFRAANGRNPYINFDMEQQLDKKLQETEEERLQLAQKLLGLCTNVLKAAGITRPTPEISLSVAEEALDQLKNKVVSLEMELQDVKLKNRISDERIRLSELRPQTSRADENGQVRNRSSQTTPFLSALDR